EIKVREIGRRAMTRAGDQQDRAVVAQDDAVEVRVDEIDAGAGAPVTEQAILDVFGAERLEEEDVALQITLRAGEIVNGAEIAPQGGRRGSPRIAPGEGRGDVDRHAPI